MSTIHGMLNIAQSALATQQQGLNVTSNNIANVNTEGYTRQRLIIESTGGESSYSIQRVYDRFLGYQMADAAAEQGRWEAQKETLEKAELMFEDVSGYGLNGAMAEFWNSWQEVVNNPSGFTERATLLSSAEHMTMVFNKLASDLNQVRADSDLSIIGGVDDINTLTKEIAELNLKIAEVENNSDNVANELRDERDLKYKELANLIDVSSFEDDDGYLIVSTANGHNLVERTRSWDLVTDTNTEGFQDVFWESASGMQYDITDDITTGKLKGWIEARDDIIPGYESDLNDLADAMATAVNDQHVLGLDLNGDAGQAFFTISGGASDIAVNSAIAADVNLIAAASNTESVPGGNGNALAMANIQNRLLMSSNTSTMDDFYNGLVSDAGRYVSHASVNEEHQAAVSLQLATYREEISGVSMDEEMVNMVQFQSAYVAASKVVTTIDEMIQTLLNMV